MKVDPTENAGLGGTVSRLDCLAFDLPFSNNEGTGGTEDDGELEMDVARLLPPFTCTTAALPARIMLG